VRQHADQIALGGISTALSSPWIGLHGNGPHRAAQPMHQSRADHRRLGHIVNHERHETRASYCIILKASRERFAIFLEVLDPHALVPSEKTPSRFIGKLHPPLPVHRQQRGGASSSTASKKRLSSLRR
jgi:hypothetical protein